MCDPTQFFIFGKEDTIWLKHASIKLCKTSDNIPKLMYAYYVQLCCKAIEKQLKNCYLSITVKCTIAATSCKSTEGDQACRTSFILNNYIFRLGDQTKTTLVVPIIRYQPPPNTNKPKSTKLKISEFFKHLMSGKS
ncbi:hypothetical protein RF11_11397 [Thelohanellus kitauei]|uniref:Uncharacterized protein n=1 Tax=Thelohanellus kitauei TaxID=669202 RepID=A0A0C2JA89_THEKT|nr:hypothetical protein RF11_11397 [Thelohanellus kitauei]